MKRGLVKSVTDLVPSRDELFHPLESCFNNFFDEFFSDGFAPSIFKNKFPKLDVIADDGKWVVEVHVPGIDPGNIEIEILPYEGEILPYEGKRMLKISGKMSEENKYGKKAKWQMKELKRSSFERTLMLPDNVEGDPEATMKNGVLKLVWDAPELKVPEKKTISIKQLD